MMKFLNFQLFTEDNFVSLLSFQSSLLCPVLHVLRPLQSSLPVFSLPIGHNSFTAQDSKLVVEVESCFLDLFAVEALFKFFNPEKEF